MVHGARRSPINRRMFTSSLTRFAIRRVRAAMLAGVGYRLLRRPAGNHWFAGASTTCRLGRGSRSVRRARAGAGPRSSLPLLVATPALAAYGLRSARRFPARQSSPRECRAAAASCSTTSVFVNFPWQPPARRWSYVAWDQSLGYPEGRRWFTAAPSIRVPSV